MKKLLPIYLKEPPPTTDIYRVLEKAKSPLLDTWDAAWRTIKCSADPWLRAYNCDVYSDDNAILMHVAAFQALDQGASLLEAFGVVLDVVNNLIVAKEAMEGGS